MPVPAVQQGSEFRAGIPARAGDQQRAQGPLQLATGAGLQRVRLVRLDAQRIREVGAVQLVPQVQLDDLAVPRIQPRDSGPDQFAQLSAAGSAGSIGRGVGRGVGRLARLLQAGCPVAGAEPAVALVARHRVQPRPEPVRFPQASQPGSGDDEGVRHGIGARRPVQRAASGNRCAAPPHNGLSGQALRIAGHDGGDDLTVTHGPTVLRSPCPVSLSTAEATGGGRVTVVGVRAMAAANSFPRSRHRSPDLAQPRSIPPMTPPTAPAPADSGALSCGR